MAGKWEVEISDTLLRQIEGLPLLVRRKYAESALKKATMEFTKELRRRIPSGKRTGTSAKHSQSIKAKGWRTFKQSIWRRYWKDSFSMTAGAPLLSVFEKGWDNKLWGKRANNPMKMAARPIGSQAWQATEAARQKAFEDVIAKAVQTEAERIL